MIKNRIIQIALVLLGFTLFSCEPNEVDKPGIGNAPKAEDLDFTITAGSDAFHYIITNTSSVTGIANWDLGNGTKIIGNAVDAYFPIAKTYTIALTLYTSGGSTVITKELEQAETDWDYLSSPLIIALTGGAEDADGKTWVIDSLSSGHLGVGEAGATTPNWWSAQPVEKKGHYLYDDEFTFKLVNFVYTINTHGSTHANHDGNADEDGFSAGYYTGTIWNDSYDIDVTVNDAARGALTWSMTEANGKSYINLSSQNGNISYDDGNPRSYEILDWNENYLYLRTVSTGNARYHKLIPKGYVKPKITYGISVNPTANPNEYQMELSNVSIPADLSIAKVEWNFGDVTAPGVYSTTDYTEEVTFTYMAANTYTVEVTVTDNNGDTYVVTEEVEVTANHPDYVPYIETGMSMYTDFDQLFCKTGVDQSGQVASFSIVDNPEVNYKNSSAHCIRFTKVNSQYANVYVQLSSAYRFDLTVQTKFKLLVYGNAGDKVLLKLENTDRGANSWQTGTSDLIYTIQETNEWEVAEFDFTGVAAGWDWTGDIYTSDITTDPNFNTGFYNIVRVMVNPGDGSSTYSVLIDDWAGPTVAGWKK